MTTPPPSPARSFVRRGLRVASFAAGLLACACGGSSSETPPPLEPLPVNLHYDRSSTALSGEVPVAVDAGAAVVRAEDVPSEPQEGPPARSTWGAGDAPTPLK